MPSMSTGLELTLHDAPALLGLVVVGAVASGLNAVAGGGSLVSFPALVGLGVPALSANATNTAALWPGSLAGAIGFLNQLSRVRSHLRSLIAPTLLGSLLGAWLLISTPERAFKLVVPPLIFTATLLLAFQPRIKAWSLKRAWKVSVVTGAALQFCVSIYGGYFGAGMGILMLAVFGLFIEGSIHELNAIRAWLGVIINCAAAVMFVAEGLVQPWPALALMAGGIAGGYVAARLSQKVNGDKLRKGIVGLGLALTVWFTWKLVSA
jgi:uncharacterized protein